MDKHIKIIFAMLMASIMLLSAFAVFSGMQQNQAQKPEVSVASVLKNPGKPVYSNDTMTEYAESQGFIPVSPMNANTQLNIVVGIKINNMSRAESYISELSTPGSPIYQKWLTYSQIEIMFGNQYAENLVSSYYSGFGFNIAQQTPFMVELSGNVSMVDSAFHANMYEFLNSNGEYLYSNLNDISIPSSIATYVASVDGLSSVQMNSNPVYPTLSGKSVANPEGSPLPSADQNYINHTDVVGLYAKKYVWAQLPVTNGPYPGSAVIQNTSPFQALFPSDLPWIYGAAEGFNGSATSSGANGTGITIAIVMGTGYYNQTTAYPAWNYNDMYKYGQEVFGNPDQILDRVTYLNASGMTHKAPPDPSPNIYVPFTNEYLGEFTLDTQYSATMAPDAHLDIMAIPSLSTVALDNAYAKLLNLTTVPQIITNSWSGSEDTWWSLYGPSWQSGEFMNELFMLLDARGSTIVAATGDSGGYDGYTNSISGEFPGTSPWVTGIGGDQVTMFNATGVEFPVTGNYTNFNVTFGIANYSSAPPYYWPNLTMNVVNIGLNHDNGFTQQYWDNNEYVISDGTPQVTQTSSGSAALSIFFTQPYWQHGYLVPNTGRMSEAQLSAEAGFNQTELIDGDWGSWFFGGTSEATPTTAGMLADVMSYINDTLHKAYLGDINPLIYTMGNEYMQNPTEIPNPYFFVSNGTNSLSAYMVNESYTLDGAQNYPSNYWTTDNGYSMLTGWGTINVKNFKADLEKILSQPFNLTGNISGNTTVSDAITMSMPSGLYYGTNYTFNVSGSVNAIKNAPKEINLSFMPAGSLIPITMTNSSNAGQYNYTYENGKLKIYASTFAESGFLQLNGTYNGIFSYSAAWITDKPVANATTSQKLEKNLSLSVSYKYLMGGFPAMSTDENTVPVNSTTAYADIMEPPMEPNMQQVNVTYDGNPVYNALVVLSYNNSLNTNMTNETRIASYMENNTVSYGLTNLNGQALIDTWNVYKDTTVFVYVYYSGMMNKTEFVLTPQISIVPTNAFESFSYMYSETYLPVWQGEDLTLSTTQDNSQAAIYVPGSLDFYGPSTHTEMIPGTAAMTNITGYLDLHIPNYLPEGLYYIGIQNSSATEVREISGTQIDGSVTYLPVLVAGENPSISSIETGTGINALGETVLSGQSSFVTLFYDQDSTYINYMWYNVNGMKNISFGQLGNAVMESEGEYVYGLNSSIPAGNDTINIFFNDTYGIEYSSSIQFYYEGQSIVMPTANVSVSSSYVSGQFTVSYSTNMNVYDMYSEALALYSGNHVAVMVPITYGSGSVQINGSYIPYGNLTAVLTVTNAFGYSSSANASLVNVPVNEYTPTARILTPINSTSTTYSNISISFAYSGYNTIAVLYINDSAGNVLTKNVTGTDIISFAAPSYGNYTVTLSVRSPDGNSAKFISYFSVVQKPAAISPSTMYYYIIITAVVALIFGSLIALAIKIKR